MRITKTRLRQIIKEEITIVVSEEEAISATGQGGEGDNPAAKVALALKQFFTSPDIQGVNAKEAGVVQQLIQALWALAQDTTITQGPVASKLQLLANAIADQQEKGKGAGEEEAATGDGAGVAPEAVPEEEEVRTATATSTGGEPTPGV